MADLLYHRYANPLELMDTMIQAGRLYEYIREMLHIRNEELEEKTAWEVWLHKIWNQEWHEFRASLNDTNSTKYAAPTHEQTAEIVKQSMSIMDSFMRLRGGVEDGTVQADGDNRGGCEQGTQGD